METRPAMMLGKNHGHGEKMPFSRGSILECISLQIDIHVRRA